MFKLSSSVLVWVLFGEASFSGDIGSTQCKISILDTMLKKNINLPYKNRAFIKNHDQE